MINIFVKIKSKSLYIILTFLTNKNSEVTIMALIEMRSVKITKKGQIAIPKDMRNIKGFKEGSKIAILAFDDRVELRPLKQINERIFTAIASEKVLAKDWNSKEDEEAWKNL